MISPKDIPEFKNKKRILLQVNEFICLLPHPGLRSYISSYNITFPTKEIMPDGFTIMPCGCSTLSIEKDSKNLYIDLHGPVTKPYIVDRQANQLEIMVTIEFKPAGLYALTGINQSELKDKTYPLQDIDPVLSKLIFEAFEKTENISELAERLDILLSANMYTTFQPELKQSLQTIKNCAGNVTIKNLSDEVHYSERQMNRIFNQYVGTSAKSFSRLVRINNTFRLIKEPHNSLTIISDIAGFHDFSHFARDFKLVCGITPQEYRNNMSDFYSNTTKF